jgi:lysophospholipid acyltransferase (LPLAT)-like uncharacterized protein
VDTRPVSDAESGKRARADRRLRFLVPLGAVIIRLLAWTWRVRVVNPEAVAGLRAAGAPYVFACWHGQMLPLLWAHRGQGIAILVSEHRDGELITRIARTIGFNAVRGSTSRGGGRALLGLVAELQRGRPVAVTPDGPRGPAGNFAPGALVAAQRAGVPVLTVGAYASSAWRLSSWDRFLIPKPFARVNVAYGGPERVAGESPRDATAEVPRFQALLEQTLDRARG